MADNSGDKRSRKRLSHINKMRAGVLLDASRMMARDIAAKLAEDGCDSSEIGAFGLSLGLNIVRICGPASNKEMVVESVRTWPGWER